MSKNTTPVRPTFWMSVTFGNTERVFQGTLAPDRPRLTLADLAFSTIATLASRELKDDPEITEIRFRITAPRA